MRELEKEIARKEANFSTQNPELIEKAYQLGVKGHGVITAPAQCVELEKLLKQIGYCEGFSALSKAWTNGFWDAHRIYTSQE